MSISELGKLLQNTEQWEEATDYFNQALEIYTRLNQPAKVAIVIEFLGATHEMQGQYAAALEKYQQALGLKQKYMAPQNVAITQNHIARVRAKMGG